MNIQLREIRESDIWILHKWINDPEIIKFTNNYRPISSMEQKEWINNINYFKNNFVFGIEDINEQKLIGTCGLYDFDTITRKAELRMKIGDKDYRGKGVGTKALSKLLDFGFGDLNLNKIWLKVLVDNKAAINLYKKAGFFMEGELREDMFIKRVYKNVYIMSFLKSEFDAN